MAEEYQIKSSLTLFICDNGGLEISACLGVKNIGKPCAGEPHARFDEGGQARACSLLYLDIFVALALIMYRGK